jgi:hypothetical protein
MAAVENIHLMDPFKALVSVVTALNFEKTLDRDGLEVAARELEASLLRNGLWIPEDVYFLADVRAGRLSAVQIAETICDERRISGGGIDRSLS